MGFDLYPVQKKIWTLKVLNDRYLYRVFKKNIDVTPLIDDEILQRLGDPDRPNWVVIQITAETGEFKSSAGLEILSQKVDKTFSADRVAMQYADFEKKIKNSEPKQAFLLDEQVFQHGVGSRRLVQNFVNIVETLRKRQNSMVLITPKEKYITDDNVTFTFEPCGFDKENKVLRLLVKKNYYIGFYYLPISWGSDLWKEYTKVKDSFLEVATSQNFAKLDYEGLAKEIIGKMSYEEKSGKINKKRVTLFVEKNSPNITKEERDLLIEQIIIFLENEQH
jgi:hypothetical protein